MGPNLNNKYQFIPISSMKGYRGRRNSAAHVLNLGTRWSQVVNITHRPICPRENQTNLWLLSALKGPGRKAKQSPLSGEKIVGDRKCKYGSSISIISRNLTSLLPLHCYRTGRTATLTDCRGNYACVKNKKKIWRRCEAFNVINKHKRDRIYRVAHEMSYNFIIPLKL